MKVCLAVILVTFFSCEKKKEILIEKPVLFFNNMHCGVEDKYITNYTKNNIYLFDKNNITSSCFHTKDKIENRYLLIQIKKGLKKIVIKFDEGKLNILNGQIYFAIYGNNILPTVCSVEDKFTTVYHTAAKNILFDLKPQVIVSLDQIGSSGLDWQTDSFNGMKSLYLFLGFEKFSSEGEVCINEVELVY